MVEDYLGRRPRKQGIPVPAIGRVRGDLVYDVIAAAQS